MRFPQKQREQMMTESLKIVSIQMERPCSRYQRTPLDSANNLLTLVQVGIFEERKYFEANESYRDLTKQQAKDASRTAKKRKYENSL
jgi:hypothetical protein